MKSLVFCAATVGALKAADPEGSAWDKFTKFAEKFNKAYKSEEERLKRFAIFVENLAILEVTQSLDPTGQYGYLTPFADWSETEFAKRNGLEVTKQKLKDHEAKAERDWKKTEHALAAKGISMTPSSYDWREKGAVTEVKDQGQCGSCWAFGTVANIEGNNYVINGKLLSLAEQELVDCDEKDNGCNGGLPQNAYEMMLKDDVGLELEKDYTYHAEAGKCTADKSKEILFLADWLSVSSNEDKIAMALVAHGPLVLGLNAGPMQLYMGGIADPFFCNPLGIDHAVTLVGYGEEGSKPFWIIKNSWGASWGEKGFYRLIRGKGKCGMNRMVTSAIVAKDAKALPAPSTVWV